jgi:hypothetical protein
MQVTEQMNAHADRPRFAFPPIHQPSPGLERPTFRPEPEGLSREELQKLVLEMLG